MRRRTLLSSFALIATACIPRGETQGPEVEMRDGQPVAQRDPVLLYPADFVVRGMVADGESLYVSGLRLPPEPQGEAKAEAPTGLIVQIPLVGLPTVLAEGAFAPMTRLELVDDKLYWHERYDSPDGPGLRSLSVVNGEFERVTEFCGNRWVIGKEAIYFTRPDDEIDEGGFYVLAADADKPKLVARRKGVIRSLLSSADRSELYWLTRKRRNGTWAVFRWDGKRSGKELLASDETFASFIVDGDDFLWVTWADDAGEPLHSLYRRPIGAPGDKADDRPEPLVLARKRGLPGFMDVFTDPDDVYLTTVRGGPLRRLSRADSTRVEVLTGTGDRQAIDNRYNLFWVEDGKIWWRGK